MSIYKSVEWKKNISNAKKGKIPYLVTDYTKIKHKNDWMGERNPNWKGGISSEYKRIRESAKYKEWRKAVFERDNYTCIWCGDNQGGNLEADHIKPRKKYPELVFDIDNGRTLCKICHRKTETWGNKKPVNLK